MTNEGVSQKGTILLVDDEEGIRKSLEGIFRDEGFSLIHAKNGVEALARLSEEIPSVVLLDIWMSGMDGMEALKEIRRRFPELPVIMMSGHATIATAMEAAKSGAFHFIEKPLDLSVTLKVVRDALENNRTSVPPAVTTKDPTEPEAVAPELLIRTTYTVKPYVSPSLKGLQGRGITRGKTVPQKTLASSAVLYGLGLHSGKKSGLVFEPLPEGSGIHFAEVTGHVVIPAHIDFIASTGFATTLKGGAAQFGTIEHLMSALHGYGITNLLVKCNGEVPGMDGSAKEFCALFDEVGVVEQNEGWDTVAVTEPIRIGNSAEYIEIAPGEHFLVKYHLAYPQPVGIQAHEFVLSDASTYAKEIAPARTFGFVKDVGALQQKGLALGGRFDNFILVGEEKPINGELRFPNEFARHKILDAIGDLVLLGRSLQGTIVAEKTGHSDNVALLKELQSRVQSTLKL